MAASALVKAACEGKAWSMGKETWPGLMALSSHLWRSCRESNPAWKIALACVNARIGYAERRESTRNDLRIREMC